MLNKEKFIYKILKVDEWEDFKKKNFFLVQSLIKNQNLYTFPLYLNFLKL